MNLFGSIQRKIAFWSGICLLLAAAVIIWYAASWLHETAILAAEEQAIAVAQEKALGVNEEIEVALNTARTLAQTFSAVKDPDNALKLDREQMIQILKNILEQNPNLVGVYTVWEPDALDGNDAEFADEDGHTEDGRFVPYWSRDFQGNIALAPRTNIEVEGPGEFYQCPKRIRLECITDPYLYSVQGQQTMITSLVVPVIVRGEFYGVVGVDIGLDFFQSLADEVDIYDGTGKLIIITHQGTLMAVTHRPELVGEYATVMHPDFDSDNEFSRVLQGETVSEFNVQNELEVFVPIYFWRIVQPWSVSILVPREQIIAEANVLMGQMVAIGFGMTLFALGLLWLVSRQIATPVRHITRVAQQVTEGNLHVEASVQTHDETRVLADTFNQMVANLRQTIENERLSRTNLEEQYAEQKRLVELISVLETPVIPLGNGVLLAPIVGSLDSRRAQDLTERLLNDVYERHTRRVILDITGVLMIDTQVAHAIIQTAQSLRLLGCHITITGISPTVATTITQLGITLNEVAETRSLEEVLDQLSFGDGHEGR